MKSTKKVTRELNLTLDEDEISQLIILLSRAAASKIRSNLTEVPIASELWLAATEALD
ncbi:hypothetical protein PBI_GRAYSON_15 [Rhodococcus phage Grayson]|nr:hypothetical protein PBI_GRAYSON_15 [Rhodococcus phage Grayson]